MKNRSIKENQYTRINIQESGCLKQQKRALYLTSYISQLMSCILLLAFITIFSSCSEEGDDIFTPKPRGYFRVNFPEKKYVTYDSACPFTFEMPVYSKIEKDKSYQAQPCWLNMEFYAFNATLHLTYKAVNNNIASYMQDSYTLSSKHHVKASGIKEQIVMRDTSHVYGLIYNIEGNTATAFQFFLTDSTSHFIHGALYFNSVPNSDSIAQALDFLKRDVYNMINTLEWKEHSAIVFSKVAK